MFIGAAEFLYSREGVTQGDPLSIFLCYRYSSSHSITQGAKQVDSSLVCFADDVSVCGELSHIREWFDYYPNPSKCCVVVDSSCYDCALQIFSPLGVQVVTSHRFLGGFLGDTSARDEFVSCKVRQWVSDVTHLAQLAFHEPQAAFAALTKCLQGEWVYLQHVIPVVVHCSLILLIF